MLVAASLAVLVSAASGVLTNPPLAHPLYFYGPAQPFYGVLPVLPVNQVASTYNAQPSEEGGQPIRAAVEAQPSDAVKAQTRMVDFLTKGSCQEGAYTPAEGSCQDYMFCVHGKFERKSCQSGLYWDDVVKVCNFPAAVDCKEMVGLDPLPLKLPLAFLRKL
eukprot:TRINITY_DN1109_c0_g1_i6.p1 TRINITY_DN1109_c0_g1~~TRINITY_DN1109_c0_g1_i6.p1  ORF type:complete len:182 (-),score=47.55 TRINITY_DN1109_c0_g1_i6:239-724(-)